MPLSSYVQCSLRSKTVAVKRQEAAFRHFVPGLRASCLAALAGGKLLASSNANARVGGAEIMVHAMVKGFEGRVGVSTELLRSRHMPRLHLLQRMARGAGVEAGTAQTSFTVRTAQCQHLSIGDQAGIFSAFALALSLFLLRSWPLQAGIPVLSSRLESSSSPRKQLFSTCHC